MASSLLALLTFASLAWRASAAGTLLALFPQPDLKGDKEVAWLTPSPATGCSAVPASLVPKSGKVWWSAKEGSAACASLLFYSSPNCAGSPSLTLTNPHKKGASTEDRDFSKRGSLAAAASAKSVSCATSAPSTKAPASETTPVLASSTGADISIAASPDLWLEALNRVRSQGGASSNPLKWDAELASKAQTWTEVVSKEMCGAEQVVLSKIPQSDASESDVWISFSTKESDAVAAWAPDLKDNSNPRTARILDSSAESVGCGKKVCEGGAFFTCLFTPITY